mmetsp:Transcript_9047/g.13885  ORF Transcript_9047/g.13885 Transcript_9047/m.13885 type:complete len:130 (+) Transcript_9047:657-1046(+)
MPRNQNCRRALAQVLVAAQPRCPPSRASLVEVWRAPLTLVFLTTAFKVERFGLSHAYKDCLHQYQRTASQWAPSLEQLCIQSWKWDQIPAALRRGLVEARDSRLTVVPPDPLVLLKGMGCIARAPSDTL